jgi:hypothetical protein
MFVKNNTARLITLGVREGEPVRLMPGVNEVDDKAWTKATETVAAKAMLEPQKDEDKPWLEPVSAKEAAASGDTGGGTAGTGGTTNTTTASTQSVTEMNATDATSLISSTFDKKLLEKWRTQEQQGKSRITVLDALDDQLEKV